MQADLPFFLRGKKKRSRNSRAKKKTYQFFSRNFTHRLEDPGMQGGIITRTLMKNHQNLGPIFTLKKLFSKNDAGDMSNPNVSNSEGALRDFLPTSIRCAKLRVKKCRQNLDRTMKKVKKTWRFTQGEQPTSYKWRYFLN